jgi:response regulator RpfG family c-di-GMP phosphodiesterase
MESEQPDLVICDLMMPRMSGLEVLKRKKKNAAIAPIPMIILSAIADDRPTEFWTRSLGVEDYIIKPFDPLDLLGRVEYLFRRSSYVSARPSAQNLDQTVAPIDLSDATPAEVVRVFVEAWNNQDFASEFQTLGEEMLAGMAARDYVDRRRHCYIDEKGQAREQRVSAVVESKISLNVAKIVIDRSDRTREGTESRKETYTLKKTGKGWKIINCRSTR